MVDRFKRVLGRGIDDLGDFLVAEEDIEYTIDGRGSEGHWMTDEGAANLVGATAQVDLATDLDLSDSIGRFVFDWWE
jgi:hypothetical protein